MSGFKGNKNEEGCRDDSLSFIRSSQDAMAKKSGHHHDSHHSMKNMRFSRMKKKFRHKVKENL